MNFVTKTKKKKTKKNDENKNTAAQDPSKFVDQSPRSILKSNNNSATKPSKSQQRGVSFCKNIETSGPQMLKPFDLDNEFQLSLR